MCCLLDISKIVSRVEIVWHIHMYECLPILNAYIIRKQ